MEDLDLAKLCILTFPQRFEGGKLYFNILILPRNINPLVAFEADSLAFADTAPAFKAMIINSLDGLPLTGSVTHHPDALLIDPVLSSRAVWEALRAQIEATDNLKIDDAATADSNNRASASIDKYKNVAIRKYLPQSYRTSFNFTKPKTRYALTGDEYHCSVKNSGAPTDTKTDRDKISWGKAIALCLRNPLLAKKAGLIFEAQIDVPAGVFDEGGWLYIDMGAQSPWATLNKDLIKHYAARIPALKGLAERTLFAAVQFPVSDVVAGNAGYDEIMREALVYDDGFAKIVHANQPLNDYLLEEEDKSNPPQKDIGIRLGWDDEQLTIWQNRQMLQKEENTGELVDAPLGVFSYCIDARKEGDPDWRSQNSIMAPGGMSLNNAITIAGAGTKIEMGSEVHPAAHGSSATEGFWLPMYFTNWMGKSLAIPDKDAQDIYQTKASEIKPATSRYTDPQYYKSLDKTPPFTDLEIDQLIADYKKSNTVQTVPKATFNPYVQNPDDVLTLEYGNTYDFRIRLMDLSGGAPLKTKVPLHGSQKPVANWHFIRHTAASAVEILNIQKAHENQGELSDDNRLIDTSILENITDKDNPVLNIRRPGLAYPAVVFTGKYKNPDAVTRLKAILQDLPADPKQSPLSISLPDPDVDRFKVLVEMKSLEMDNALSLKGNEPFVKLYEKFFDFSTNRDEDFALRITYKDHAELPFDESFAEEGAADELSLPSARHLRLTFTPVVTDADNIYADDSILFGKPVVISSYKDPIAEPGLLTAVDEGIKAFFLQPEGEGFVKPAVNGFGYATTYLEKQIKKSSTPVELERIADALNISANNLTLEGLKGERTQFGCTRQMRHSLAPDSSSITFSSLAEVFNHWVIAVNYTLQRDWTWDGLNVNSFLVSRQVSNKNGKLGDQELVGLIKVSRTANINALSNAQRDHTNLIFLDTLDPKDYNQNFPEELFVTYTFEQKLTSAASFDEPAPATVNLPVTTIPAQIPKLVSVGLALSPYEYDEKKYDATNTRQKFIWLEFDEPPLNKDDTYYIRVLANSPDPMLCMVNKSLVLDVPEEPPLNINPEKIRTIIPGMDNDFAGVGAMQEMIPEQTPDPRFYMVPLPAGLHTESDELFGFFTCEIRVGHKKELWSTAQGRYGRPLKVNGMQHPAPALFCNTSRRKSANPALPINEIMITAPFANAVYNGKNVAALPPQTSLWSFLYAQVKQADGKANRNILLASRLMRYKPTVNQADEGNRYGLCSFNQTEVSAYLRAIGLPVSSGLSVLCVEMYPLLNRWRIDNRQRGTDVRRLTDEENKLRERAIAAGNTDFAASFNLQPISFTGELVADDDTQISARSEQDDYQQPLNPLVEGLGKYRIYRTSALVPVENICCDDC